MTFCGNCGSDNPAGNRFCFSCGAELGTVHAGPQMNYEPPVEEEIERIGAYDPNKNYNIPPAQPYQQQAPYGQPQQPYQQPPYGQNPYQQQAPYGQPYQQAPPYGQQYPYPPQQPYGAYPGQQKQPIAYLPGCPDNNKNFRFISIILAFAALVVTVVALFAIPMDGADMATTLFGIGVAEDGLPVLVFAIVSLVIAAVGIFLPIVSIVTGVCVICTAALILTGTGFVGLDANVPLVIGLGAVVIVLGLVSSLLMNKYVRSNVRNVTMFQCSLFTWKGIPAPNNQPGQMPYQQPPMQRPPYQY